MNIPTPRNRCCRAGRLFCGLLLGGMLACVHLARAQDRGNTSAQEYGDAVYRELDGLAGFLGYNYNHAAVFAGLDSVHEGKVMEALGSGTTTHEAYFYDEFTSYGTGYYGAYTLNNRTMSFTDRKNVVATASDLVNAAIAYPSTFLQAPVCLVYYGGSFDGTVADISNIRCDGVVEYAYEKNNFRVWRNQSYGDATWSIVLYPDYHNDRPDNTRNPEREASPWSQRGAPCATGPIPSYGCSYSGPDTKLNSAAVINLPAYQVTQSGGNGYVDVTVRATDESGIHYIGYERPGDSGWSYSPTQPQHPSSGSYSYTVRVTSSGYFYAFAVDNGGNYPTSAPGYVITVTSLSRPTAQTLSATEVTTTSAKLRGQVTSNGGSATLERRLEWAKASGTWGSGTLGIDYGVIYDASITGSDSEFSGVASGLQSGVGYKYRAWARNAVDWSDVNVVNVVTFDTPASNISVTVQPSPSGRSFSVDGTTYTTSQTFTWISGSSHPITATSPQSGGTGIRYVWSSWSDGGAVSHSVAPTSGTTYTANFTTQYYLTVTAGTGGNASPSSGWSDSGAVVGINASPNGGYSFGSWTGSGNGSYSGSSSATSVTMNGPIAEAASFTPNPGNISVTVQPSVSGLSFTVDGTTYTSAQLFSWVSGSSHPIATSSPQAGATGIRYVWSGWSDGGAISHSVAPTSGATYTASFTTQYYLALSAGDGGSVSPASDWYGSGAVADINATPASGYSFSSWTGTGSGCYSGTSASASVTMNGPVGETASFAANPGNVSVTVQGNPSGVSFTVDGNAYASAQTFSWASGSSHPISTTTPQGGGTGIQYIWSNWSDGGAMSHTVAPTGGTTYTANFATQYRLDTGVSPAGGGTVVLSPAGTWFSPAQAVQLTASASSGYAFSSWAGVDRSSGGNASVTMNGYRSVTANFTAISPGYTFITLAGSASAGSQDGAGATAGFNFETGAASDKAGNVYIADTYNSTIRRISPDGVVTTVAGSAGIPGSANGVGSAARFLWPNGVAVEDGGTVYVADTYNNTIRKITPAWSVSTLAGAAGAAGFADGVGGAARFSQPGAVAVDSNGVLYVADGGNNAIRRITPGGVVGTLAGWTNAGYADGVGTNALLNGPAGVAVDAMGNVFVADTGNNTIRKIATNGVVSTLAGLAGTAGHADGVGTNAHFNGPAGVAVDAAGNVFVADTYNYTIRRVAFDGTVTTIAGAPGQYGYRDGAGTNALFDLASGVAVDGMGNVYVADTDNNVVRKGWWSGTLPEVVLQSPEVNGGQVQLDFTVRTGTGGGFTLLSAAQAGGPWSPDVTALLATNVLGVSYTFTTWPGASAQFYRIESH